MIRLLFATTIIFTLSVLTAAQNSTSEELPPTFQTSFPFISLQESLPTLDSFKQKYKLQNDATEYVFIYSGKISCPDETKKIGRAFLDYLVTERIIDPPRIIIVDAGYRSQTTIELFVVPLKGKEPKATPTLEAEDAQLLDENSPQCKLLEENLLLKKGGV